MISFCEINLAKQLQAQISSSEDISSAIDSLAQELCAQDPERDFIITKHRLEKIYSITTNTAQNTTTIDLRNFFRKNGRIDGIKYEKVKRYVQQYLLNRILGRETDYVMSTTSEHLTDCLNNIVDWLKNFNAYTNDSSAINHYFSITVSDGENVSIKDDISIEEIADYLMINHLPVVVNTWMRDMLKYDHTTGEYSFNIAHKIRTDYRSDDDKEVNINGYLDRMLEATPIYAYDPDGPIEKSNRIITRKAFLNAIANEVSKMSDDVLENFLRDPYTLFNYLIDKYTNDIDTLTQLNDVNSIMMYSFIQHWQDVLNDGLNLADTDGYHPVDIIIKAFDKYRDNTYYEYDVQKGITTLELKVSETSTVFGQMCDKLDLKEPLPNAVFDKINGKWEVKKSANYIQASFYFKSLFGFDLDVEEVVNLLESFSISIAEFYNQSKSAKDFFTGDGASTALSLLNRANLYNPYIVSGTRDNKLGKALPIVGVKSVANSIKENVLRNKIHSEENGQRYDVANLTKWKPITPAFHSTLSKNLSIFDKTVYDTTLNNGDDQHKGTTDLSTPEAFLLAFKTKFWDQWNMDGGKIAIQAITPSDKSKIPSFTFFAHAIKQSYGATNPEIEKNVLNEIHNVYAQQLINTLNDFALLFNLNDGEPFDLTVNNTNDEILKCVNIVNEYLQKNNITENDIRAKLYKINTKYGLNKNIAIYRDYVKTSQGLAVSPYCFEAIKTFSIINGKTSESFDNIYLETLKNIAKLTPTITLSKDHIINVTELYDENGLTTKAKKSPLYTYFLIKNVLGENILINTVGTAASHKFKPGTWAEIDSNSHITMVKRMVAHTATMHSCMRNVFGGLPNQINTMTISNEEVQMFAYSGNGTEGDGSISKFDSHDGAMYCPGFVGLMLRRSIPDVQTAGIDQKLFLHSQDAEKNSGHLLKMANYIITNAFLRMADRNSMERVKAMPPHYIMQISLQNAFIDPTISIEDGKLVNYDGYEIDFSNCYFLKNGIVVHIEDVTYDGQNLVFTYDDGTITKTNLSLYEIWNALGAEYSCDENGIENESSQELIYKIITTVGNKLTTNDYVHKQSDVNTYLQSNIVHYFPTDSGNKSTKTPVVNLRKHFQEASEILNTYKLDIENFGIQLDPDHDAADGEIKEITQLISFMAEGALTPELTQKIYKSLKKLLDILSEKTFIDIANINDPEYRNQLQERIDSEFGEKIKRIFADPNTDVMGLANEIARNIDKANKELSSKFKIPYSDGQVLGKVHTSIGSMFNKYISRTWTGRADVIVPSHNFVMVYEDDEGFVHMNNDFKIIGGLKIPIVQFLRRKVWDENGLREDFKALNEVRAFEVMPGENYYDEQGNIVTIDTYDKMISINNDILSGAKYYRAIDLPRNLRPKQAYLEVNGIRIGMYYLNTFREIFRLGKNPTSENVIKKKQLQQYVEQVLLPAIHAVINGRGTIEQQELIASEIPINIPVDFSSIKYITKNSERLTTNNYSNVFGIQNMNVSEITQRGVEYFIENLQQKFSVPVGVPSGYDFILYNSKGTPTIIYNDVKKLTSNYVEQQVIVDEDGYRVDNKGNQLYKWPAGARLYMYKISDITIETIVLPNRDQIQNLNTNGEFIFWRTANVGNDTEKLLYIGNIIEDSKINTLRNIQRIGTEHDAEIFRRIAQKQYDSWVKTNKSIISRIPAQSQSFAMVINTVGYLPFGNNVTMVPNFRNFLSGEDYDIDKLTAIMYALDRNGMYEEIKSRITLLDNIIPIDNLSEADLNALYELVDLVKQIAINPESKTILIERFIQHLENDYGNIVLSKGNVIEQLNYDINVTDQVAIVDHRGEIEPIVDDVFNAIRHNLVEKTALENARTHKSHAIQNVILDSMVEMYEDPRTLMSTTNPTTMQPITDAVNFVGGAKNRRSHWDVTTDVYVNQTTAVGKKDIGISAVAQKAFFALTYYYDIKSKQGQNISQLKTISLPEEWRVSPEKHSIISLCYPGQRLNDASYNYLWNQFNDWHNRDFEDPTIKDNGNGVYVKLTGTWDNPGIFAIGLSKDSLVEVPRNSIIGDFVVTTINSSIISSSTDNAKEMKMDLLNATPEILPVYEYLLSLGVDLKQSAKILTDPLITCIINITRGNYFNNAFGLTRASRIFTEDNLKILKTEYSKLCEVLNITFDDNAFNQKIKVLSALFKGAEELTTLGQSLGINGGIKVEFGEPLLFKLRLEEHVKDVTEQSFDLSKFLGSYYPDTDTSIVTESEAYALDKIKLYEAHKSSFNILDIIYTVDHYKAMFTVPLQFMNTMQILSKDVDNTYKLWQKMAYNHRSNLDSIHTLLRAINDVKIINFFIQSPFVYKSDFRKVIVNNKPSIEEGDYTLSTNTMEGLLTLKQYIETIIIPRMQESFQDNEFVLNLVPSRKYNSLFNESTTAYGSRIRLTEPLNEDRMAIIKDHFYVISNINVEGHSIYEWMFIYDLLVHKHNMGRSSLTMLFDSEIDLTNSNHIATKWTSFVNNWDSLNNTLYLSKMFKDLPGIESKHKQSNHPDLDLYDDDDGSIARRKPFLLPSNDLPLYMAHRSFNEVLLLDRMEVYNAFRRGNLILKRC